MAGDLPRRGGKDAFSPVRDPGTFPGSAQIHPNSETRTGQTVAEVEVEAGGVLQPGGFLSVHTLFP